MQNAAIAYKISNNMDELNITNHQPVAPQVSEPVQEPVVNTANVPLNPAEPLVMPTVNKAAKASDDGFDDFK